MSAEPSWDLFRTFAAVMRDGSLSAAARALGLTQPSVSRHIEELERQLDSRLFVRSPQGLTPTDAGLSLAPYAEELVRTSAALLRAASSPTDTVAGTVRVSAGEVVAVKHLPAILAALRQRHPALAIELVLSNAVEDLLARRADIAVRMVEPTQQALVARKVGAVTLGWHARHDYLERRGTPASWADLAKHDLIAPENETPFLRKLLKLMSGIGPARPALRTDSDVAQLAAIQAGLGIGVTQVEIARRDPTLRRVLAAEFDFPLPIWIVMHEDLRTSLRCRAVFDALAEGLAAMLAGR